MMSLKKGLILLILATISPPQLAWIVPQPRANVWTTLVKSLNQDHICLSTSSASDPLLSCLVGIPYQMNKFPFTFPKPTSSSGRETHSFIAHQPDAWRRWVKLLPVMNYNPEELESLGSSPAFTCVHFAIIPDPQDRPAIEIRQVTIEYTAKEWCQRVIQVPTYSTPDNKPHSLPKGIFLICGRRAWAGIPPRLIGGPCTFGQLSLFTPNKTQISHWQNLNKTYQLVCQKRDTNLEDWDHNCDSQAIHWSTSKNIAAIVLLPWMAIAKTVGELALLECWVAKQANLTSSALLELLSDEEITRQATLQNWAAIDFLLLLHNHCCEEFAGLCCLNLSSRAEDIHATIQNMQNLISDLKKESSDWLGSLFQEWGLSGWIKSLIQPGLLLILVLAAFITGFSILKGLILKALNSTISVNRVRLSINEDEHPAPQEEPLNQDPWFKDQMDSETSV
ncbi:uncharacterized protein LOC128809547 [Vidua macroura]|uniref:uncharacterized protein LOC128809547 n=1 Tax=Vidua macroura TaxID=187451 RepID=UPI0023A894EC|nr:uncharacterized protein LOC128809547 [Vidua macroura]XP_053837585.1 uncharacterized protein LOC128809547 [Vidua macroura]XP_053837586.1 uncharacterized protein LOC128809547 [Vidua macroura]